MSAESRATSSWTPWLVSVALIVTVVVFVGYRLAHPPLETLVRDAEEALKSGRLKRGIELARQAVTGAPESVDAAKLLAYAGLLARDRAVWEPAIDRVERLNRSE